MSAPADPRNGIVQWELTRDEAHRVIAMLLMGAAAWEQAPTHGAVDEALRPRDVAEVRRLADELATIRHETWERQQAAYAPRRRAKGAG